MNAKFNSVLHVTSLGKLDFCSLFSCSIADLNYEIHSNAIDWEGIKLISTFRNQSPCGFKASNSWNWLSKLTTACNSCQSWQQLATDVKADDST